MGNVDPDFLQGLLSTLRILMSSLAALCITRWWAAITSPAEEGDSTQGLVWMSTWPDSYTLAPLADDLFGGHTL